jgi:thiosulfate/3-mercaptopyruvate sulfurtransferase
VKPRHNLLATLAAFTTALGATFSAWAAQPLLAPADLSALLGKPEVRVIDIRPPKDYAQGRIPGAVSAPYGTWRGPASNPGELPDLAKLTAQVQKLGLTPATHAVVVSSGDDATDFGASARVYWTLKVLGLKELSVLNGGLDAWTAAKLPQDNVAVTVTPSTYAPALDTSLIATREDLIAQQKGGSGARLVDARPAAFYTGDTRHQASLVPGTIKGASNLEYTRWFAADSSAMLPADEVKKLVADAPALAGADTTTVSFCNTGHWAAINWFALSEVAGKPGVKMYPGSMVDWSQGPGAEAMDNVPSRLGQLVIDFKLWAARTFN